MNKTPSFLKGLGERRARAEGEVQRLEALKGRISEELDRTRADLASYDRIIRLADPRLDPAKIPPIRCGRVPTKGSGKKESLEEAVLKILGEEPGAARSTVELAVQLTARMGLDFEDTKAFGDWLHNSVARRLKKMVAAGVLVRLHDPLPGAAVGWWALPQVPTGSLAALAARERLAGAEVEILEDTEQAAAVPTAAAD